VNRLAQSASGYALIIAALHALGIALLLPAVAAHPAVLGIGFLAYTLGLRHAFDADHIAAIDGVVRKLVQERRDPLGVGFFFSLGHSTVVFVLAVAMVVLTRAATSLPALREIGGFVGTLVSGGFLVLIGIINLIIWFDILVLFRKMQRAPDAGQSALDDVLSASGIVARFAKPLFALVKSSRQAYPIGFLFGLGFDTASEIALLGIAAAAAATALPLVNVLALPLLFAAGMTLMDTLDGIFMTRAYHWAFSTPLRKLYYNLTVTGLSVVAALAIGSLELASVLGRSLGSASGFWAGVQQIDFGSVGFGLVTLFALTWLLAAGVWRFGRFEERST
jgi:high-affinity nickel-transport protein